MDTRNADERESQAEQAGITATNQPAATGPTLHLGDYTVTELWRALFDDAEIRDQFIQDVRAFANRDAAAVYEALDERDVPTYLQSLIHNVGQGRLVTALRLAREIAPGVVDLPGGDIDGLLATASLFGTASERGVPAGDVTVPTPVVTVVVGEAFRNQRRDQRADVCRLLATLADGVSIRVVASDDTLRWLAEEHAAELPGVSEWCNRRQSDTHNPAAIEEALATLDPDGTKVEILRLLAEAPDESVPYKTLHVDRALPSKSAVRRAVGTLADLELVERYGSDSHRTAELTATGRAYLDRLEEEQAAQRKLGQFADPHPTSLSVGRVTPGKDGRGEGDTTAATDRDAPRPYRTRWMDAPSHAGAAAAAAAADVTVVRDRLSEDERTRPVSVNDERDEIVASVPASGPLQHMSSVALAFASDRVLDAVITDERLSGVDEPPAILRDARCVGALSDEALDDAKALREAFREWGEALSAMTTDLYHGEYDDRSRFRGEILRTAHGLAGSLAHLFDVLGYDIVRELRVPKRLDRDKNLAPLARSVAVATAVQSTYGAHATYRQLFEQRDDKRESAFTPEVDAADPCGRFIGSLVVRGPDVHRFREHLEPALASPGEVHDDAPEIQVPMEIAEPGRTAIARATRRILSRKRLQPTPEAVSLLNGMVRSPHDVAKALEQLGRESRRREVQPDEIRYALATLPEAALLPDHAPTLGKVMGALLRADERLSQTEVANRADVSTQSVRRHRDRLAALGLVEIEETDRSVTLALSFASLEGGTPTEYPGVVTGETSLSDAVDAVAAEVVPTDTYLGPVYEALAFPPDPWSLRDKGDLRPWVELVARLADVDPPEQERTTVAFGPTIEQVPISGEVEAASAA